MIDINLTDTDSVFKKSDELSNNLIKVFAKFIDDKSIDGNFIASVSIMLDSLNKCYFTLLCHIVNCMDIESEKIEFSERAGFIFNQILNEFISGLKEDNNGK